MVRYTDRIRRRMRCFPLATKDPCAVDRLATDDLDIVPLARAHSSRVLPASDSPIVHDLCQCSIPALTRKVLGLVLYRMQDKPLQPARSQRTISPAHSRRGLEIAIPHARENALPAAKADSRQNHNNSTGEPECRHWLRNSASCRSVDHKNAP